MVSHGEDKPPSRRMKRYWRVAVLANIKDESHPKPEGVPPDAFADFDHIETIDSIRGALETDGHQTVFIQADEQLPFALLEEKPDICFNIAEGLGGDAREAQDLPNERARIRRGERDAADQPEPHDRERRREAQRVLLSVERQPDGQQPEHRRVGREHEQHPAPR